MGLIRGCLLLLVVGACSAPPGGPDASFGDAGTDAGVDAGVDAGSDAGVVCARAYSRGARPGLPWELWLGDGGRGDETKTGCEVRTIDTKGCWGPALVVPGDGGPDLWLDGGFVLRWATPAADIRAPALTPGEVVNLALVAELIGFGPYSGTATIYSVSVRAADGGMRWLSYSGAYPKKPSAADTDELFGLSVTSERVCTVAFNYCGRLIRTEYAHVLQTTPETRIEPLAHALVSTPRGWWDLRWSESSDERLDYTCADAQPARPDTFFAASWQAP
jgi:hypothetical protein